MLRQCQRCNVPMEIGYPGGIGLMGGQVVFIVPGEPTSDNPVKAFKQGL